MHKKLSLLMLLPFLQGCSSHGVSLLWQAPIASDSTPIVRGDTVYVQGFHAGHPGDPYRIYALDIQNGRERWASADAVKQVYGESGGSFFFLNPAGHLVQLNSKTGEKLHESADDKLAIRSWAIQGDVMFILNGAQEAVAVDNRQNKELWRKKLPFHVAFELDVHLSGPLVIVSGNDKYGDEHYGKIFALDAATGKVRWTYTVPPPHDYAPLKVLTYDAYVLATNTSPTHLGTHVLDAATGKELYPPIYAFDLRGFHGGTMYASGGAFDLRTGQRTGGEVSWASDSVVNNGVAWKRRMTTVNAASAFLLRTTYDGDYTGKRDWTNTPPNSSLEGFDIATGKSSYHTPESQYTRFSVPMEADGVLYHTSIAFMKEGKSGVWAYRLK